MGIRSRSSVRSVPVLLPPGITSGTGVTSGTSMRGGAHTPCQPPAGTASLAWLAEALQHYHERTAK